MKLSLFVTQGTAQGKSIPITVPQFIIGRDPQCHLRPSSPVISKRHCAIVIREGKAFLRDFGSTNGSFVNGEPLKGERELKHKDQLKIGPLFFEVRIEMPVAIDKPTPLPEVKGSAKAEPNLGDEEAIADLLLDGGDQEQLGLSAVDQEPDMGSTILDLNAAKVAEALANKDQAKPPNAPAAKKAAPAAAKSSTQSAAEAILAKMHRRNRK
jgi:pSer/pThr/pTyr-binding forkhead associated (FHA) protein